MAQPDNASKEDLLNELESYGVNIKLVREDNLSREELEQLLEGVKRLMKRKGRKLN